MEQNSIANVESTNPSPAFSFPNIPAPSQSAIDSMYITGSKVLGVIGVIGVGAVATWFLADKCDFKVGFKGLNVEVTAHK